MTFVATLTRLFTNILTSQIIHPYGTLSDSKDLAEFS